MMISRLVKTLQSNSFFLFGARGTGKSTLLKTLFDTDKVLWIDLLNPVEEDQLARNPDELRQRILKIKNQIEWVIIDEVQKVPSLLNLVHQLIESDGIKFALTGSSARKLKHGSANLLAGRAFVNHLHPLTHRELGASFDLSRALRWGTLPRTAHLQTDEEKNDFLRSYALTYLKEEVWGEQMVRNLDPFRRFLEVAAQTNGEIVNYANIGRDVGADTKTVQSYFQILEDTLLGIMLEPFHRSLRKRQSHNPKFYFFDLGVCSALARQLTQVPLPGTSAFGRAFEHLVILEMIRLNDYLKKDFRFSYLRTKDGAEIDLIIERPGRPEVLVEIKSSDHVDDRAVRTLKAFSPDFPKAQRLVLSRDPHPKKIDSVDCLPWQEGIVEAGLV